MFFFLLLPLFIGLALLVLTAIVTAVIAVVLTLLPVNKVPFSY